MNIREISDVFKDTADEITAIKSYNFGWASDRARQGNTEDFQELNEFPRVFFAVPTITGSDQTRKQDTYQVTLFFDDLLGYDNEGDEDPTLQIDKWANLQQYANYFIQRLNKIKQSILPNYLFIPEAPSITFDSFTGIQRMITVQLSFNLVVPTNCDPGVITLVQCIANIVTSSNLTASLKSIIKFAASLEGRATVTADIALVQKVASSLNAFGTLTGDINFVQKLQASLVTSASVTGNITIPKLVQASLTGTGTTAADLTVGGAFDADAQAFFNRVTTAGGTLTITEQNAVNTLVLALKANGIWTKMNAIYPMVGGAGANPAAACAQNLKSASFTGTFSSGWTFANTGVTPNGTSAFMNTFLNPTNHLTLNSVSFGIYSRTNNINAPTKAYGVLSSSSNIFQHNISSGNFIIGNFNVGFLTYIPSPSTKMFIATRRSANILEAYRDSISLGTDTTSSSTNANGNFYFGARNRVDLGTADFYTLHELAFSFIGDALTNQNAIDLTTIVNSFQSTLSRAI